MKYLKEKGITIFLVLILVLALSLVAGTFIHMVTNYNRIAQREVNSTRALYLAEAGIERALYDLRQDFVNDSTPSWADGSINGVDVSENGPSSNFYELPYEDTSLGAGSYTVQLKNVENVVVSEEEGEEGEEEEGEEEDGKGKEKKSKLMDIMGSGIAEADEGDNDEDGEENTITYKDNEIWIKSTGTVTGLYGRPVERTVQIKAKIRNYGPWGAAIFAGSGASGSAINGNVDIRGSVLILGTGLTSENFAVDMGGSSNIGNNYEGIPDLLSSKIPASPATVFGEEAVYSLDTEVRVKRGKVGLTGNAKIGSPNLADNDYKETVDGVYIPDGYGGSQGADSVYSDNGTQNPYDLDDKVQFPSLSASYTDPDTGTEYSSYQAYLQSKALSISINNISNDTEDFELSDIKGNSISWTKSTGRLVANGIIYVTGDLDIGKKNYGVTYSGKATLIATEDISIHADLLSNGTFPTTDSLGLIAANDLNIATGSGESQVNAIGAFYAGGQIVSDKQNKIAGSFVSNYFNMGDQVPSIYQVPVLSNNLPPGMIGPTPVYIITTSEWKELF